MRLPESQRDLLSFTEPKLAWRSLHQDHEDMQRQRHTAYIFLYWSTMMLAEMQRGLSSFTDSEASQ